mmetsp:Transcript_85258/g.156339  ORF Transcript_85258/g.156339 Transcript_85258/m.156339 type:complete len:373 (+) Transcript_85258:3-1121(+)
MVAASCRFFAELAEDEDLWRRFCLRRRPQERLHFLGSWRATALPGRGAAASPESGSQSDGASRLALPPFPPAMGLPSVPVRQWSELTAQRFLEEFDVPKQPVIIPNAAAKVISDLAGWGLDELREKYSEMEFSCVVQEPGIGPHRHVRMRLCDYLEYAVGHTDLEPLYLFDDAVPPPLLEAVKAPHFLDTDYFSALDGTSFEVRWWMAIGGPQSGTRFHVDPFETSAWNLVTEGRKRWVLFPPSARPPCLEWLPDGSFVAPGAAMWFQSLDDDAVAACRQQGCLEVEQGPGDLLFVPSGWWHCVANLEVTVAYTQNVITSANHGRAVTALERLDPEAAALLRAASADKSRRPLRSTYPVAKKVETKSGYPSG